MSIGFLRDFFGVSLGILLGFHDSSMGFLWDSEGRPLDSYGNPIGFP